MVSCEAYGNILCTHSYLDFGCVINQGGGLELINASIIVNDIVGCWKTRIDIAYCRRRIFRVSH